MNGEKTTFQYRLPTWRMVTYLNEPAGHRKKINGNIKILSFAKLTL